MKKTLLLLCCLFSLVSISFSQDIQLTQFYASPLYLNPAFTGSSGCTRLSFAYRNQWTGVSKAYSTSLFSIDHALQKNNIAIGLIAGEDQAGTGNLKTTVVTPSFAYQLNLSRTNALRFGLQTGAVMKKLNFNNLLFGDQLLRSEKGGGDVTTIETFPHTKTYLDINAGLLLNLNKTWIGVSASHINRPNESFYYNPTSNIPIKYSAHIGSNILLNKDEKYAPAQKFIAPIIHYKHQQKFDQLDVGFYYTQSVLNIGLWYRGIPVLKSYKSGYSNNDALSLIIGIATRKFNIGYSYDITISNLSQNTKGSHEISMSYQFCPQKKKKPNPRVVYCPKF
ncbi:MAG: type IX secretion system membrane protein PorP/SprF [Bacteroidota bacterium]